MLLFIDSYRQSVEVHRELNAKHALASYTKAFFSSQFQVPPMTTGM